MYPKFKAKKPLSPLFDRFMNDLMGENIKLTLKEKHIVFFKPLLICTIIVKK